MKILSINIIISLVLLVGTCWIPMAAPADELQGLHGSGGDSNDTITADIDDGAGWRRVWNENIVYVEEGEEFLMESEVSRRILQAQSGGTAGQATSNPGTYCNAQRLCDCIGGPKCSKCNPRCISD